MLDTTAQCSSAYVGAAGALGFDAVRCGLCVVGAQALGWKTFMFNADISSWNTARVLDMSSVCALWPSCAMNVAVARRK